MALLKAANLSVESYWPSLFAKLCEKKDVGDLILNVGGGGGGGAVAASAPVGGAPAAAAQAVEEKKVFCFATMLQLLNVDVHCVSHMELFGFYCTGRTQGRE